MVKTRLKEVKNTNQGPNSDSNSLTRHVNLKRHKFLMKLEESPMFECLEEEETSIHVLTLNA